jgi:hypothetical protein
MYILVTLSGHTGIQHSNSKYMDTSSVVNSETVDPYLIFRPLGPEILNFGSVCGFGSGTLLFIKYLKI